MQRDLLLLLLGAASIEPFAFDDDDDDSDDDDGDDAADDDDDSSSESKKKDTGKKKDEDKSEKKSKLETPEALKRQVRDLQKELDKKTRSNSRLSRENKNFRLKSKGVKPRDEDKGGDDDDGESETAKLRQTVTDLTDRLDNISSENFIEKNVIRKLQPLVAAGLDDDEADRKLNAALRLVDSEEDFDDDGNFDAEGFLDKYPYLAVDPEAKQESARDRLLGGSGKKNKSGKNYAGDALKKFNERRNGKRKAGTAK